tara:strand:- start:1475 stop:1801 length:327 start_codon:yes stop_codon:yes gene_type:complete
MISEARMNSIEYKIYVGVGRLTDTDEVRQFIVDTQFTDGLTITEADGVWLGPDDMEEEDSLVITILSDDITMTSQIRNFADAYAAEYYQMQVIWSETPVTFTSREYER